MSVQTTFAYLFCLFVRCWVQEELSHAVSLLIGQLGEL